MGGRWATQELAGGAATLIYRLERLSITLDGKVVWSSATVQESRSSIAPQDLFLPPFATLFPDGLKSCFVKRQA